MSKIALSPNASGTGTLSIVAPNTNTDRTLTLPDNSGTVQTQLDQGFSFRNRIINGDMRIDQRNAGAEVNPAVNNTYYLDRWSVLSTQTSKFKIGQNAGAVTPPTSYTNYLGITSLSAYSVVSSDVFEVRQNIEGLNVSDLAWGTANAQAVTLSFWVRSSLTGTFGGALQNSAYNYCYPFTFSISAANTWEQKTITVAGPTSGTWLTTNGVGLRVVFGLGVGATYSGTAGSWASTEYHSATGATSVVGTSGATFYITGVQLEAGSVATTFERRPYGTELALCQRYYEITTADSSTYGVVSAMYNNTSNNWFNWQYKCTKRATPTFLLGTGATWSTTPTIHLGLTGSWFTTSVGFVASNTAGLPVLTVSAEL